MIFFPFFSNISFDSEDSVCPENFSRGNRGCKYLEMSKLWYIYVREFLPKDKHIYIIDNCSPLSVEYITKWLPESYEFIGPDNFSYNDNYKIHIKRYPNKLIHRYGATRLWIDFIKFSYFNKLDYFVIEGDALIGYDVTKDFENYNFCAKRIHWAPPPQSVDMWLMYVKNKNIDAKIKNGGFDFYMKHDRDTIHELGEGTFFREFCFGNVRDISNPDKFIHDASCKDLQDWIIKNKVNHEFVDYYLNRLDDKIKKGIN